MRIIPFCGFASVPPDLAVWLSMANKTLRLLLIDAHPRRLLTSR